MQLLNYDITTGKHRTAEQEWPFHATQTDRFTEWHYITLPMTGANGHQYFLFFTLFNFDSNAYRSIAKDVKIPEGMTPMMITSQISDYTTGVVKTFNTPIVVKLNEIFDEENNAIEIHIPQQHLDVSFSLRGDQVKFAAKTPAYHVNLEMSGAEQVMWMRDAAVNLEGLIQEGDTDERSFYYSLPKLPVTGTISIADSGTQAIEVYGAGWIDRQWGDFVTKAWEWTSFRFGDGDRINTYNFHTGYQVGILQKKSGEIVPFNQFKVVQNGHAKTPDNAWFSFGWDYHLPVKDPVYKLIPLSDKNVPVAQDGMNLFEGLSRLLDASGTQVGWAVTETMDIRTMHNGPYDKFNNF